MKNEVRELLSFIDGNPTAYHTTASVRDILLKEGFSELLESRKWHLEPGKAILSAATAPASLPSVWANIWKITASTLQLPTRIRPRSESRKTLRSTWARNTQS